MSCIGFVVDRPPLFLGNEVPGLGKVVELHPYRVRRLPKLLRHLPQIGRRAGVREELQEHLDAGFGCDEGVEQGLGSRFRACPGLDPGFWALGSGFGAWKQVNWEEQDREIYT